MRVLSSSLGRRCLIAAHLLVVAAFAACGGDEGGDASSVSPRPAEAADGAAQDAGTAALPDAADSATPDARAEHDAADAALEAMLLSFWDGRYLRSERTGTEHTGYWIFAQAFDAVLDGVTRTGGRYEGLIETFYLAQDAVGWQRDFFDDENWMALALLRAYDLTGKTEYLSRAESLFADIQNSAQDSSCCLSPAGGLWWDRPHTQKATAANAGPVITAVRLFQRTNKPALLDFAKSVFAYWDTHMVDPVTHALSDHVKPGGEIVKYKFTYNEGLMIGACLALFEATKDPKYLTEAHAIAGYLVDKETMATPFGPVLFDGTEASCTGDCPQFKGIGYRYLAALHAIDPKPSYAAALEASAKSLRDVARDKASGLFGVDWTAAPGKLVVESAISASSALSLFASAKGPYGKTIATTTFEAEEGVLHGVGLEARYAGFRGFGYVAGWNADGQWVDFHTKATPGKYKLTIRYAADAGDASRLLHVNGVDVVPNLAMPATGGWDKYATVESTVQLAADNTISIVFNGGQGSKSFLNLDQVSLTPAP